MTSVWANQTLGDVCRVVGGGTPPKNRPDYYSGDIPWATVRDMRQEIITETECKITKQAVKNSATKIIPTGNVVIATRVGLGKVCILAQDTAINQDLRGIIPINEKTLAVKFLFWWLKSIAHLIEQEGTGATVQGVKLPFIKSLQIPIPSLAEQHRLVGILEETFEAIATAKVNAEQNLQNASAVFGNYLQSVFAQSGPGWVEKPLGEVCAITSTLVDPRKREFLDLIHVGAGNIESKTGVFIELKTAREEALISGKFIFDKSMVLYSKIRPYLMKVARPDFNGLCSADMYPLAPLPNEITRDYLFHLLLSKHFTDYAIQGSARAGMPKVNRDHLFDFKVRLPAVTKQKELAAKLDKLHEETLALQSIYQQKVGALDALKESILHLAFAGGL